MLPIGEFEIDIPRALIIDDEPGIRFALKRWFERQGFAVSEVADAEQALKHIADSDDGEDSLSVIVCDMHLPGITGDELHARLTIERPALAMRMILTTGDSVGDAAPGTALANHPFVLQKPFDLVSLKAVVSRVQGS